MKKLYDTRLFIYSLGLLISSIIERLITYFLDNIFVLPIWIYHLVSIGLLLILFLFTNILIKRIISSKFIIKKVFKREYIGGRWIEIIYDDKARTQVSGFTILDIQYTEDKISVSGKNFDADFRHNHDFSADSANMTDYNLSYVFKSREDNNIRVGYGSLNFAKPSNGCPKFFIAHFIDKSDRWSNGYLIDAKEDLDKIDNNFISGIREISAKYINRN